MAVTGSKSAIAYDRYTANKKKKPGEFTYSEKKPEFSYDSTDINKYYNDLLNRKDFSFDLNSSALYNQMKDQYTKQGQLAMMDTMGQATAMTGGYGNSYAASAGQQAYQQNLDKLNEAVPEIYQLALEQYQIQGQNMMDKYAIAAGERDTAYGMYRDETADYYADKDFAYGQYRDSVADWQYEDEQLYGRYADERDYERQVARDAEDDRRWQVEQDYQRERDTVKDNQWQLGFDYQKERDAVTDSQWEKTHKETVRMNDHTIDMDNKEYDLQVKQFTEQIRQFEKNYALSERELDEMCKQWAADHNLDVEKFKESVRQYNTSMEYQKGRDKVEDNHWQQTHDETVRVNNHNMYIDSENLKETKANNAHNQYMDKALLEEEKRVNIHNMYNDNENLKEDKKNNEYNRSKSDGGKNGGMGQEDIMNWLADYGLLTEDNIVSALTDFDSFIENVKSGAMGKTSSPPSTSSGEYNNSGAAGDTELSDTDQYFLNHFSDVITKYGYEGDDEQILSMLQDPSLGLSEDEIRKYYSILIK